MNVPPFVPSQIVIPGNVAEEPYRVRVGFLKRVTWVHGLSVMLIFAIALAPLPILPLEIPFCATLIGLLGLSLVRGLAKGWRHEQLLSALFVPPLFGGLAYMVLIATSEGGWPWWALSVPVLGCVLYTLICGNDLSFMGMFVLVSGGVTTLVLLMAWFDPEGQPYTLLWLGMVAYVAFFTYDIAALQTRRRLGEEMGAVLDLYRDVLNFTTYPVRVIRHWRRHRIWSMR